MTPEQERVYFNWKRICWAALINESLPAVVVFQDRLDGKNYCVWTQWHTGDPTLKFFQDIGEVRQELRDIGLLRHYPDFQLPC